MSARPMQFLIRGFALTALCMANAVADVQITVSITGTPEEMLPILERLRELGAAAGVQPGDPLKLEVQSNAVNPAPPAPAPETSPAPATPAPAAPADSVALKDAKAEPSSFKAGDSTLLTVSVADSQHKIDTVGAMIAETGELFDLYDDGTNGDATSGDGIWSKALSINAPAGTFTIELSAYDSNGALVMQPSADGKIEAVRAKATINIEKR